MLRVFIKLCHRKKLSPRLTIRLLSNLKYVAQVRSNCSIKRSNTSTKFTLYLQTFALDQSFIDIFSTLKHFLKSDDIRIQFEAVESLTHIFNHKWLKGQADDNLTLTDILKQIHGDVRKYFPEISPTDDIDKKSSHLAIRAQFHCSIVASCFCLRNDNWFRLFELCCVNLQIKKGKLFTIDFRLK